MVDKSDAHYLVDHQGEGEILMICFGFFDFNADNKFDFYKRLKKLEVVSGKKISKLLLRDKSNSWYLHGVESLGSDVDLTVAAIKQIIAELKPSKVITIGQSMGGYAAILYGALLEADQVISFGPLSCFDSLKLEIMRDWRWMDMVKKVEETRPEIFYNDLPTVLRQAKRKTEFEIFYGTHPGADADRGEAVNYDAAHASALYGIDKVRLFPVHNSPHAIAEYFRSNKIMDDVLLHRLFGTKPVIRNDVGGLSPEWVKWLEENISLGCSDAQLMDTLEQNNFTAIEARAALSAVHAKYELEKITA